LDGWSGGYEGGFEIEEGNATGAVFEESAGSSKSEDSGTAGDDGVSLDGEAGESAVGWRE
jgi:hypothetical protein